MEKYRNYFNSEIKIFEFMQTLTQDDDLYYFPNKNNKMRKMKEILNSIVNEGIFKTEWIDNSKATNFPPDFYSNNLKMMMDVMRFNDFEIVENNKIKNPQLQHESKVFKELKDQGVFNSFPNFENFININSGVSSSYENYLNSFKRVIANHDKSFSLYKKNHPNFKLIYFLFDESEFIYYENYEEILGGLNLMKEDCNIHLHYLDSNFLEVIKNSKADYVIWFAPYKKNAKWNDFVESITIFDVKNMDLSKGKIYKNLK